MKAYKCDRCGVYYDDNKDKKLTMILDESNSATKCTNFWSNYSSINYINLCDDCLNELINWLKRRI